MPTDSSEQEPLSKPTLAVMLLLFFVLLGVIAWWGDARPRGEELIDAVAHVQSGSPAAEAQRLIGAPPDAVRNTRGVLVNGWTFLAAGNSIAAQHGPPETYEARIWRRGRVTAVLYVDQTGHVAGRHWFEEK